MRIMKTEKEIRKNLRSAEKELKETRKRFEKYDNHDDLELIPVQEEAVNILKWVLGEND
jgi:hypothetical protein